MALLALLDPFIATPGAEPLSFKAALDTPDASHWIGACLEELEGLDAMKTWVLMDPPARCNILPVKWVFKLKRNQDGTPSRFKARLCAKGFRQKEGVDYQDIFAPVASAAGFRALMASVATHGWHVRQIDFHQAFLNGTLKEEVYIQQPEGFQDGSARVLKLLKSLYGLKQAPRAWHDMLKEALLKLGYVQSHAEPGLYIKDGSWLLLYVDDQLIIGPALPILLQVITDIGLIFHITDMGACVFYLGVDVDITPGQVALSQARYIKDLILKYPVKSTRTVLTPGIPRPFDESPLLVNSQVFPKIVGALMYLAVWTRPDISNATQKLTRVLAAPTEDDLTAAYRIIAYLSQTQDLAIIYRAGVDPLIACFCDADYASDPNSHPPRRSTSGVVVLMAGGPIIWSSKTQPSVALSVQEAEYMAANVAARDIMWLRNLLPDLDCPLSSEPIIIQTDNQASIQLLSDPILNSKSKHIDIMHHYARERIADKAFAFQYVPGADNVADLFTKPLDWPTFSRHRAKLLCPKMPASL
jgi:histone deacetylase 1/2